MTAEEKKTYWNERRRVRYATDPKFKETRKKLNREATRRRKFECFSHYSNGLPICACCGEKEILFLTIDHINNNGNKERKELKKMGRTYYVWLRKNNYPDGLQVLCMNCNWAKGRFGLCPHIRQSRTVKR